MPPGLPVLYRHRHPWRPGVGIPNLKLTALIQLSDGAAHATYAFAMPPLAVTDPIAQAQSQKSAEASIYLGKRLQK